ncbi:MAG: PIG-L deacetylase family protein [Candidatus Hodarchaeales archaeon]
MNILVVTAHHDDLELGCGGSVAKFIEEGNKVFSLVMTHSGYQAPDQTIVRAKETASEEAKAAAHVLGYELISFDEDTFDIQVKDSNIVKILKIIQEEKIDTVLSHWHNDTHPPHLKINQMVLHASRNVPRVLGFEVNWYIGKSTFSPNFFIPISEVQWEKKIEALRSYKTEYERIGSKWVDYFDRRTKNFGIQIGVSRAEGFHIYKFLWSQW